VQQFVRARARARVCVWLCSDCFLSMVVATNSLPRAAASWQEVRQAAGPESVCGSSPSGASRGPTRSNSAEAVAVDGSGPEQGRHRV